MPDAKFDRMEELFHRTTQFNATGQQFTAARLARLAASQNAVVFALHVSDRFADHGLVGAAVIEEREITGLVMSCRVLGMGVEHEFIRHIVSVVGEGGVTARIVPMARNIPVRNIYRDNGFVLDQSGVWLQGGAALQAPVTPGNVTLLRGQATTGGPCGAFNFVASFREVVEELKPLLEGLAVEIALFEIGLDLRTVQTGIEVGQVPFGQFSEFRGFFRLSPRRGL